MFLFDIKYVISSVSFFLFDYLFCCNKIFYLKKKRKIKHVTIKNREKLKIYSCLFLTFEWIKWNDLQSIQFYIKIFSFEKTKFHWHQLFLFNVIKLSHCFNLIYKLSKNLEDFVLNMKKTKYFHTSLIFENIIFVHHNLDKIFF